MKGKRDDKWCSVCVAAETAPAQATSTPTRAIIGLGRRAASPSRRSMVKEGVSCRQRRSIKVERDWPLAHFQKKESKIRKQSENDLIQHQTVELKMFAVRKGVAAGGGPCRAVEPRL